ncbi:hypothetical protein B0H11DRAFT_2054655 [Mycena galericulata]|nr:hypothetical protein B0H11DRAFT_2054655 [Mycena galericulata]
MIFSCSALVALFLLVDVGVAVPLDPSPSTSGSTSTAHTPSPLPSGTPLPSSTSTANTSTSSAAVDGILQAIGHLPVLLPPTIKQQLNTTLMNLSPPGAIDRWVTADPISFTSLGSDNPTASNADLSSFVDQAFTDDPTIPGNASWVDTYIDFLIEVGSTNITETQESALFANYSNATTAFATAQVKLVQAYETANPNNVTYVGINIHNVSKVDPLSLSVIEEWGSQGNGSYSKDDYADYIKLNTTLAVVKEQCLDLSQSIQIDFQGSQYKISLSNAPPIFNLSMVVGGQQSPTDFMDDAGLRVAPAWTAWIINNTVIAPSAVADIPANFTASPSPSASSSIGKSDPPSSATSSTTAHAARSTPTKRAFSPVESVAKDQNATDTNPSLNITQHSVSQNTSAPSPSPSVPSTTDPLGDIPSTLKGNLMIFSIIPGSWADILASSVQFAVKERPDVAQKYFGTGTSGMGPIGRIWTHVCVMTTDDPDTPGLNTVQILGKVWDVLPALKG